MSHDYWFNVGMIGLGIAGVFSCLSIVFVTTRYRNLERLSVVLGLLGWGIVLVAFFHDAQTVWR